MVVTALKAKLPPHLKSIAPAICELMIYNIYQYE